MVGFLGLYSQQKSEIFSISPALNWARGPWVILLTWYQFQSMKTFVQSYDYAIKLREKKSSSPCWELNGPLSINNWIPFTQRCTMPSLVDINLVVLHKKLNMWKVYRQTDIRRTAGDQKTHLVFQLRWTKNNKSTGRICRALLYLQHLKCSFLLL